MPPRIALEGNLISNLSLCRSCRLLVTNFRSLSTNTTTTTTKPESPRYIEIPTPVQEEYTAKPRVKGTLPVPRELFPRRRPDKPSELYIKDATPEPTKAKKLPVDQTQVDRIAWKSRMAAVRRKSLREGLLELYERKQRTDRAVAKRSTYLRKEREHLVESGAREDETLTNSTIIQEMQPVNLAHLPDPNREQRLAAKRERYEAFQSVKREARVDALQTLYLNARDFITSEEQLQSTIDRLFRDEPPEWRNRTSAGQSIWNLGFPPTIAEMLNDSKRVDPEYAQSPESNHVQLSQKRIGKIADNLGFKN